MFKKNTCSLFSGMIDDGTTTSFRWVRGNWIAEDSMGTFHLEYVLEHVTLSEESTLPSLTGYGEAL
jgi:hypothetical protein